MMGWDQGILQRALDQCVDGSGMIENCSAFNVDYSQYNTCKYHPPKIAAVEHCSNPRPELCGSAGRSSGVPPAIPAVAPPSPQELMNSKPASNVRVPNAKVVYETITTDEFVTTTLWEKKRSVPTDAPVHADLRIRFAGMRNHRHQHQGHQRHRRNHNKHVNDR